MLFLYTLSVLYFYEFLDAYVPNHVFHDDGVHFWDLPR